MVEGALQDHEERPAARQAHLSRSSVPGEEDLPSQRRPDLCPSSWGEATEELPDTQQSQLGSSRAAFLPYDSGRTNQLECSDHCTVDKVQGKEPCALGSAAGDSIRDTHRGPTLLNDGRSRRLQPGRRCRTASSCRIEGLSSIKKPGVGYMFQLYRFRGL